VLDDVGPQVVADRVGIPLGGRDQPLHAVRRRLPRGLGELPAIAPLGPGEHRLEVSACPTTRLRSYEVGRDPLVQRVQLPRPPGDRLSLKHPAPAVKDSPAGAAREVQL
jgi:hypothetical protein